MKKFTLLLLIAFISLQFNAQENNQEEKEEYTRDLNKKYEIKINTFNLIALSSLDFSYEKLINSESSFGVALFYNFTDNDDNYDIGFPKKFSITPYYRWFFSDKGYARGFFVEGFGMLNTYQNVYYNYDSYDSYDKIDHETGFALGISAGGKFVTKSGFTTEVYLGVGRNLIKKESHEDDYYDFEFDIVGRFGISLGYRF